jgi:drug/metabolite transporter (DMT)-like permease
MYHALFNAGKIMAKLDLVLILFSVAVIGIGQIIFKFAAREMKIDFGQSTILIVKTNLFPLGLVLLTVTLYCISTLAWVYALRTVPLSVAYMFNSLAFVLVPLAGFLMFGEQMPRYFILGLVMIIGGIYFISRA